MKIESDSYVLCVVLWCAGAALVTSGAAFASSHREAPLITAYAETDLNDMYASCSDEFRQPGNVGREDRNAVASSLKPVVTKQTDRMQAAAARLSPSGYSRTEAPAQSGQLQQHLACRW
jgi:hypothetical protein